MFSVVFRKQPKENDQQCDYDLFSVFLSSFSVLVFVEIRYNLWARVVSSVYFIIRYVPSQRVLFARHFGFKNELVKVFI